MNGQGMVMDRETEAFLAYLRDKNSADGEEAIKYFDELEELYKDILKKSVSPRAQAECERFRLLDRLKNSPYESDQPEARPRRELSLWMYRLSGVWDGIAELRHSEIHEKRKHLFFLTYCQSKSALREEGYTAQIFNTFNPPDKRLVSLSLAESTRKVDCRLLLHEMGHYIGFRNRVKRSELLKNLIYDAVWGRVYQICLNRYDDVPYDEPPLLYNVQYSPLENLRQAYCERLFAGCFAVCRKVDDQIGANQVDTRDLNASDFQYFSKEYARELLPRIDSVLNDEAFWNAEVMKDDPDQAEKSLYEEIHAAVKILLRDHQAGAYQEIEQMLDCIEEPTADCFMIAVCGMDLKEYLELLLEKAYDFWKTNQGGEKTPERFCEFFAAPEHRIRVLAICLAMDAKAGGEGDDFAAPMARPSDHKAQCIRKARDMLRELYEKMLAQDPEDARIFLQVSDPQDFGNARLKRFAQSILNPQARIAAYIYSLMQEYKQAYKLPFPQLPLPRAIEAELADASAKGKRKKAEIENEEALNQAYGRLRQLRIELKNIRV